MMRIKDLVALLMDEDQDKQVVVEDEHDGWFRDPKLKFCDDDPNMIILIGERPKG